MGKSKKIDLYAVAKMSVCVAFLCISSYLTVPLPFTAILLSLHTVAVNLTGLLLSPGQAAGTIIVYLLMGLIGLPVFSAGSSGPGKLFGPTGGFYFGFLFAVVVISLLKGKKNQFWRYIIVTILLGIPVQHLFGVLFMCFHNGFNIKSAFLTVSLPFIPGDVLKCVISSMLAVTLNKIPDIKRR